MHTQGKWTTYITKDYEYRIKDEDGNDLCGFLFFNTDFDIERICQMNNSFDDLLEACKESTAWIAKVAADHDQGQTKILGLRAVRTLRRVNKAIAKAEIK